jgi:IMP dehydrogenase
LLHCESHDRSRDFFLRDGELWFPSTHTLARRIAEIHEAGSKAAVAATPGAARRLGPFCAEHGADLFLVQSQVSSARHLATGYDPLSLADFTRFMPIPVAVGNTTNSEAAFALMEQGAAAVFVGVGPGAACTTREVLGIGVPQVTAISDVAAARDS